jgi:predicted porin
MESMSSVRPASRERIERQFTRIALTHQGGYQLKTIQPKPLPSAKKKINLLALAVAATLPLVCSGARADEISDLKAQLQAIIKRLSDLEASQAAAKAAPPAPSAPVAGKPVTVNAAMRTDVSGSPIDLLANPITIYGSGTSSMMLYGIIEATLSSVNHQTPGGGTASGFQTSWFSGNRLGFDMQHALGLGDQVGLPGLKVIAKLESEYELPTGNMDTANVLFNRDAWMGFYSDDLGKITFGRQNTLTRDFTNNWGDPYGAAETSLKEGGYTNVNNFKQLIFYSGGPNSTRYNSAIEWKKKWDAHWISGLAYKFGSGGAGGSGDVGNGGSIPGDFTNGTAEAASLAYNGIDLGGAKMNVNGSWDRANVSHLTHTSLLFGGNVTVDKFRLNAGYIHYTAEQGANNSVGDRTDHSWTVSGSYLAGKTELALGYQEMKGSHAGLNGAGKVINAFGNTAGVTRVVDGAKDSFYGSIMFHEDRQLDLYLAFDYFHMKGDWVVGDALGNGLKYGVGQPYSNETEVAIGARYKF